MTRDERGAGGGGGGGGFANREGGKGERPGMERLDRPVRVDEEKEADDDDGYKGGCPSSFSSQT